MGIDWDMLETIYLEQSYVKAFNKLGDVFVPGEGDNPKAFLLGEAPGATEVMQLKPFVGDSGILLRRLMATVGLFASGPPYKPNCWLTNVVKFRPPGNRTPTRTEIMAARPFLQREWIAVGRPQIIISIGGTALNAISSRPRSILKCAGKHWERPAPLGNPGFTHVWPMLHPSYGLRNEEVRPRMEEDWLRFGEWFATYQG